MPLANHSAEYTGGNEEKRKKERQTTEMKDQVKTGPMLPQGAVRSPS